MEQYIVEPELEGDISIGTKDGNRVYIAALAETGPFRKVWFGAEKEFVTLILGKRGSGKSFTLGSLLEGLATQNSETTISHHINRRAILLLDPMGNFWTTGIPVSKDGSSKVRDQWKSFDGWNCHPEDVEVKIWIPDGFGLDTDPPNVETFQVRSSDLDAQDLADICNLNLIKDPQGILLEEAFYCVTEEGWSHQGEAVAPNKAYDLADLVAYLNSMGPGDHAISTIRSLRRTLQSYSRSPLFSKSGTPLTDILEEGVLSILMLPLRVGHDLRRVITRILIRRILKEREIASQIRQRLDVENLLDKDRNFLENQLSSRIPKTILALDEAQELLGEAGGEARQALEDFCLLGRNYGLSLIMATQRPTGSAISPKVRSQVDTYFIHQLLTQDDIEITKKNLLSSYPKEVRAGYDKYDYPMLVRSLKVGQALVTSSSMGFSSKDNRVMIVNIRPRVTVHGGEID